MYEVAGDVAKILWPYYEEAREYQLMSNMFKKLHLAYDKAVDVLATGKRYLGRYFKVAFYGRVSGCTVYLYCTCHTVFMCLTQARR